MKKKRWILLLIVFVLGSLFIFPSFPVNADSGWDSDYGGGGSSSSGGGSSSSGGGYDIDFDSGSSYDVNHSREYYIVCFIIMLIILTSAFYCLCRYNEKYRTKYMRVKSIIRGKFGYYDKLIAKLIPGYNEQLLLNELYSIFVDIQKSRMEFDYDKLEKLCVDELYQSYKADLEVLKLKNEKIILDHYRLEEAYINSIKKVENQIVINISLSTSFVDCVINTDTEKIIRGNRNELIYKKYSLTYVIGIDKTQVAICPSCGAEVKGGECSSCNSIVKEAHRQFMLSKQTEPKIKPSASLESINLTKSKNDIRIKHTESKNDKHIKSIFRHKDGYYDELIAKLIPGYNELLLLNELYLIFVDIQKAWMEFDYDKLERLCVDELYQSYKSDLEVLKLKNGKNIMDHFRLEDSYINSIKEVDDQIVINISLSTSFVDYVINTDTGKVIRGYRNELIYNTYSLTYVIDVDKTQVAICPSCGAEVKGKKCPYCHSVVKEAHHHFMLSKKTKS